MISGVVDILPQLFDRLWTKMDPGASIAQDVHHFLLGDAHDFRRFAQTDIS